MPTGVYERKEKSKRWLKELSKKMKGNKFGLGYHPKKNQKEKHSQSIMKKEFITTGLFNDGIITGLLLSDAHLKKTPNKFRNSNFQMSCSTKYEEMIDFTSKYLNDLGFDTHRKTFTRKTGISSINLMTKVYPDFTELRKIWYPNETKIVPRNLKLTPRSLAYWFMGDGTSRWAYKHFTVEIQFCTESFSISDCLFLKYQLESLNIVCRLVNYRKGYRLYIKTKKDVTRLMDLVTPFTLHCFYYKIKVPQISLPLWKTDRTKKKCQVQSCKRVAPKGRIVCGRHRHGDLNPLESPVPK